MAKESLRVPISSLMEEKTQINNKLINVRDRANKVHEDLARLRQEEYSYREASEALGSNAKSKPAKIVFQRQLTEVRKEIEAKQQEWEVLEKERIILTSQVASIEGSIRDLSKA